MLIAGVTLSRKGAIKDIGVIFMYGVALLKFNHG
jgi:hypothetical protein